MKKILSFILFLFISITFYSQRYENAVGLRGGYGSGLTYKHNMGDFTLEVIGAFRPYYSYVGVLGEIYKPLDIELPGSFNLFFGGGAHFGHQRYYSGYIIGARASEGYFGLDGIVGVEYEFEDYPINISLDYKPELNFSGFGFNFGTAASIRYEF